MKLGTWEVHFVQAELTTEFARSDAKRKCGVLCSKSRKNTIKKYIYKTFSFLYGLSLHFWYFLFAMLILMF